MCDRLPSPVPSLLLTLIPKKKSETNGNPQAQISMKELPKLSNKPQLHPDCCASLSSTLIAKLAQILPADPSLTLSIGSGSGILEALILWDRPELHIQAVEVARNVNQYLSEENLELVSGTWHLCPLAAISTAWIFVYPREYSLVQKYLRNFGVAFVQVLIWLGPRADLSSMEALMENSTWVRESIDGCDISQYEALVVWRRSP